MTLLRSRYRILESFGEPGGFSSTYLALDTLNNRACIIKQFKPPQKLPPEMYVVLQERFEHEAATLKHLSTLTDQIPVLYEYFGQDGEYYMVQELIDGLTLSTLVKRSGQQSEMTVRGFLNSILPLLSLVHSSGIIHRDVKPSNIIIRSFDQRPVLIDFGSVKVIMTAVSGEETVPPSIPIGTQGYSPPEQWAGHPVYASDLYSLGQTVIYLLTAKAPSSMCDPQTGRSCWRNYVSVINDRFAAILDKVTDPAFNARYLSADQLLNAISDIEFESDCQSELELTKTAPPSQPIQANSQTNSLRNLSTSDPYAGKLLPLKLVDIEKSTISHNRVRLGIMEIIANEGSNSYLRSLSNTADRRELAIGLAQAARISLDRGNFDDHRHIRDAFFALGSFLDVKQTLKHASKSEERVAAIRLLSRIGGREVLRTIQLALFDSDSAVRREARAAFAFYELSQFHTDENESISVVKQRWGLIFVLSLLSSLLLIFTLSALISNDYIVAGFVFLILLICSLWMLFLKSEGFAICPNCGSRMRNIAPLDGTRFVILCGSCQKYYEGARKLLWEVAEDQIDPLGHFSFSSMLPSNPVFPSSCCVCGQREDHQSKIMLFNDGKTGVSVQVPHCNQHSKGAALTRQGKTVRIGFRSHTYLQRFCKLNRTTPL